MGAIKDTIEYEVSEFIDYLRKMRFWIYVALIFSAIFFLLKNHVFGIICILVAIILLGSEDYKAGLVIARKRKKMGIPTKRDIQKMKEK